MIVTISNTYGSGALAVGREVARRLGYEFVDEQLPVVVAKRLRTSPEAVESAQEGTPTMSERMLRVLELGTPELSVVQESADFDEACLREVANAVREYAARGNAVILGRGASQILGRRPDVLRLFLHAPRDWRIGRIAQGHGVEHAVAAAEVDRIDRARREYIREHYDVDWGDPAHYDLAIDTASTGIDGTVELILRAVELRG